MAELEIGPETINIGGSKPSIPSQDPVLSELSKTNQQINNMAAELLYSAARQRTDNLTANALISYKTQLNKLDDNVANIKDFGKSLELYQAGLAGISDNLQQEFPNLPSSTLKTIQLEMSNDYRSHVLKATTEQHQQGIKDLDATIKNGLIVVANSKSKQEHDLLAGNILKFIDKSVGNGYISSEQAKFIKNNFLLNVQRAHLNELAETHPEQILTMDHTKAHVPAKDFLEIKDKAYKNATQWHDAAAAQFNEQRNKDKEWLLLHPEDAVSYVRQHRVPLEYGESVIHGHIDEFPENPNLVAHVTDAFTSMTNPKEIQDKWVHEIIPLMHDMNPTDKTQIHAAYTQALSNSKNDFRNHATDLSNNLRDTIYQHRMNIPITGGIIGKSLDSFNSNSIRDFTAQLKEAKTADDQQKIHDLWNKKIDEFYINFMKGKITPETKESP